MSFQNENTLSFQREYSGIGGKDEKDGLTDVEVYLSLI